MSRVLYSCAMSLDGFIAGPGGDMHWLLPFFGPDPTADDVLARTGALLIGRRTFEGDDPNAGTESEGAFGGAYHGPSFVLTHRPPDDLSVHQGVRFVGDVETGVAAARAAAGDRDVTVLGAAAARACLEAGLLDEIVVIVVPLLLGDGTRLFEWAGGHQVRLHQRVVTPGPASVALTYDVLP